MIVSPLDYELYSRVTGQPIPMSAAERMKMAPVVNEFTKNYTKAQNRGSMGRNILKIGALGALGAAAYYGTRDFGTPSQELGQDLVETSTASNLVQNAAEKAAASTATNTISQSITTNQTPEQSLENAAETSTPPSQLNINESVEASVKKPTPNIDAALERRNLPLPSEKRIREKYSRYQATTPRKREKGLQETLVGGGSIFLSKPNIETGEDEGETIKTKAVSGFDAKGKSILNKFVKDLTGDDADEGDMENITSLTGQTTPDFENVLVSDTTNPQDASLYGAFATPLASPINDHPDMPGGEDDIFQHGGMNTSPTTNLRYIDPKKVMAMSVVTSGNVSDVLKEELSKKTPEEKAVIAVEIEKKRTPNPLEQRAIDNKAAMDSMKLSDEEREKESIRLGSTGGIPNKTDMAKIRKSPEFKAAQESMKSESTGEKVNGFLKNFPAQSVIRYGQMGGKASGIELNPSPNGEPTIGFAISDPKEQKTTKYTYPANKEVIQELSQDPDDSETSDESMGRKKFNYLLGLAKRGEKGIGERTKKEEFDTFVNTSKLEM